MSAVRFARGAVLMALLAGAVVVVAGLGSGSSAARAPRVTRVAAVSHATRAVTAPTAEPSKLFAGRGVAALTPALRRLTAQLLTRMSPRRLRSLSGKRTVVVPRSATPNLKVNPQQGVSCPIASGSGGSVCSAEPCTEYVQSSGVSAVEVTSGAVAVAPSLAAPAPAAARGATAKAPALRAVVPAGSRCAAPAPSRAIPISAH